MLLYSYYFWRIWYQNCTSNILKYHLEYLHTNVILTSYHYVFERCWFSLIKSYQNHLRTRFFSAHRWVFAALEAFVPPKSKRSLKESLHRRPSIVFCWVFLFVCSFVCLFVCLFSRSVGFFFTKKTIYRIKGDLHFRMKETSGKRERAQKDYFI